MNVGCMLDNSEISELSCFRLLEYYCFRRSEFTFLPYDTYIVFYEDNDLSNPDFEPISMFRYNGELRLRWAGELWVVRHISLGELRMLCSKCAHLHRIATGNSEREIYRRLYQIIYRQHRPDSATSQTVWSMWICNIKR